MTTATALNLVEELRIIADELEATIATPDNGLPYGTIVKAKSDQARFKPTSLWVSLGNGTYKHLTGKKGLTTKHERLDGFVDVVFSA